jgi:hypothetical protein
MAGGEVIDLSPEDAADVIRAGGGIGPMRVSGRLDLKDMRVERLPSGLRCYDLDASGSRLQELPEDLQVESRLILDNCPRLKSLPVGLTAGSISLRNCQALEALPEGLSVWFLDLTGCSQFTTWPRNGTIHNGSLILRNCVSVTSLPRWVGRLAQLDLAGCVGILEIPEGISVSSWVDVGASGITSLPNSLLGATLRWRGVRIDERIAFHPEQLSVAEALAEKNAEKRRVIIERMGYARFAAESNAKVLDRDKDAGGKRELLRMELKEDEPLVILSCLCPSTGRQYFLRVPPGTKSCHQAAAWIAGFDDPSQYRPAIET